MPYNDKPLRHRHYGRIVMNMVDKAVQMEDGEEKTVFINTIANHMKKCFVIWNKDKDDVSTDTIVADINELSEGKLHDGRCRGEGHEGDNANVEKQQEEQLPG